MPLTSSSPHCCATVLRAIEALCSPVGERLSLHRLGHGSTWKESCHMGCWGLLICHLLLMALCIPIKGKRSPVGIVRQC